MKYLILIFAFCLTYPSLFAQQAGITIGTGTHIIGDGGATIVIHNGSLTNNGEFQALDNKVIISGTALTNQSILGGSNTIYFDELELDKMSNDLQLETDIEVFTKLKMSSGNVLLNNNNITLSDPSAIIEGETETKRISGSTGGEVIIFTNLNNPVATNPGNLGAEITAPGDLGSVEIRRGHVQQTTPEGGISIQRYYDILPANNSNLDATLRFHYFDAESAGVQESEYELYRFAGAAWQPQNVGFGPADRDPAANWIQKTGIPGFSRWTVGSGVNNVLPVELLYFTSRCEGDLTLLEWATATETNAQHFTIEWSHDSHNWSELTQVEASGNSSELTNYSFFDERRIEGLSYYRIGETDIDGNRVLLETLTSDCYNSNDAGLAIYPNPVLAGDGVYLDFHGNEEMPDVIFELYNTIGQVFFSKKLTVVENDLFFLPISAELAAGHYFLRLRGEVTGWTRVEKIEVIKE